ncbi:DUF2461 domain-containing protein [Chryseobacterium aquaticum]|uniref:DUF2461 domain-containing protein n=1 Tax=Chryseobacterium aquaticum TaxID=452084 RepID=A0A848N2U7_9FLAO|nr:MULTISPECIES: DUF2461 domain-containing protein [Chryseobacterium]NMR33185.1 DUF2461 domain-containing protein [Chryseobacterium aquaticum]NRQ44883.1 DUF2461 domain-containing protein [Chryseobacterium sp. C-204]
MIKQTSLSFLTELKNNNSREWFEQNKIIYQDYKNDIISFTENLLSELEKIDLSIAKASLIPKKCLTRVNRDLRFSKDKTPYKNYVLVVFNKNAPQPNTAGYFIHIEPGNCMAGGGVWQTSPEYLKKIRQEISYSFDEFNGIISSKKFRNKFPSGIQGQSKLKKFTDFPEQREEVIELLKMKGFCTKELISDKVLTSKDAIKTILNYFETTKPLIDYINKAIEFEA